MQAKRKAARKLVRYAHGRLVLAAAILAWPAGAEPSFEWPNFRGPAHGGPLAACALPAPRSLEVVWKKSLGAGYSGVSVAGGKAVTLYATDSDDLLAAFDAATGEPAWQLRLGAKRAGDEDLGDCPISTAAIDGGVVYALGRHGALVAAALDSGKELWRVELDEAGATVPTYGFAASPLVWRDLVILPTGGDGHAVTAFDKKTGQVRWTAESGSVSYQSAALLELAGREQLVVVADRWLAGLEPATGKTWWKHPIAEGSVRQQVAHVTPAGKDRLLLDLDDTSIGLQIAAGAAGLEATERFRTPAFASTLALPVYHQGTLYGFTGRFLTALDAETGQILWRSRPPGGDGLTLVDGKLAVVDRLGELVLIAADPKEYREIARAGALENGKFAWPSFAGGNFYVRNFGEIAALRPSAAAPLPVPARPAPPPPQELRGEFGRFLAQVKAAAAEERQPMIDEYFAGGRTIPIFEPGLVHFVYRGDADEVVLLGGGNGGPERPLERLGETDLFFFTATPATGADLTYTLRIDHGEPQSFSLYPALPPLPALFGQ